MNTRMMSKSWYTVFEDPPAPPPPAPSPAPPAPPPDKTFTQEQVDTMVSETAKKHQTQAQKALEELDAIKTKAQLSETERVELNERIDTMKNQLLTKEELAKKDKDKLLANHTDELKLVTIERDSWKSRYTESTIIRNITDEAVANKAFVPEQVVNMLWNDTNLIPVLDSDDKPTGELQARVKFPDVDKEGKPCILDLTIAEAVKRMTEIEKYYNLFKGEGTGGMGLNNRPSGKNLDIRKIATDPAAYREARKKGEITF